MIDTIYAVASGAARSAVCVVRISGPAAGGVLEHMAGPKPAPRFAAVRRLRDPVSRETLDQALVLWMPGPHSFTGEDVVELHLHGGKSVVQSVVVALEGRGLRLAEPGEFTRRAFMAGRMTLVEAEGIADLVDADSDAQRRQALAQMDGFGAKRAEAWRGALIEALAGLEALIDFPDEDLPIDVLHATRGRLLDLRGQLAAAVLETRGRAIREGYRVALVGAPNAGKSSLLNALVGKDVAIVTDVPGTTRDVIERGVDIAGFAVILGDTAGLRVTGDVVEAEGVRRAREWAGQAALRLWVVDVSQPALDVLETDGLQAGDLLVLNKCDLAWGPAGEAATALAETLGMVAVRACAAIRESLAELRAALTERVRRDLEAAQPPVITRERHRRLLGDAVGHLDRALAARPSDPELVAENVRLAARALDALLGRVDTEAVLGAVFSTFCIGK